MNDIPTIITNIISWVVWPIFAGFGIGMFLYAGILFLTAAGDPSKITRAKMAVLWATVGIVVGLLGYGAINIIKPILGVV